MYKSIGDKSEKFFAPSYPVWTEFKAYKQQPVPETIITYYYCNYNNYVND
jgi:hypothetical protein